MPLVVRNSSSIASSGPASWYGFGKSGAMGRSVLNLQNRNGFTLIELMIVVSIIGTLSAVVVPNFLSVKTKSLDGAAKANLRNMIVAQEN